MKIKPEDLASMRARIAPLDTTERREWYRANRVTLRAKDLDMRYRWDLLHMSRFPTTSLYRYLDDTHIDTALRSLVEKVQA